MDDLENIDPRETSPSDQLDDTFSTDPWQCFRKLEVPVETSEAVLIAGAQQAYNGDGYRGMFKYLASEEVYPMNMVLLALADLTAEQYTEINFIHTPSTTMVGNVVLQAKRAPEFKLLVEGVLNAQAFLRHVNAPLLESEFPERNFLEEELKRVADKLTPFKRSLMKVMANVIAKINALGISYLGHHEQRMFFLIERYDERCLVVLSIIYDEVVFEEDV